MPYTTPSAVKAEFPQFSLDQWGSAPLPSDAALAAIIKRADEFIDDYCRQAYQVPFAGVAGRSTPTTITDLSLELSVIAVRRLLYGVSAKDDQQVETRHRAAISLLDKLGAGRPPVLDWPRAASGTEALPSSVLHDLPELSERIFTDAFDP